MADQIDHGIVDVGIAGFTLPGQKESGDLEIVKPQVQGILCGVVDGLGHGAEAARAARTAIRAIEQSSAKSVIHLVMQCHEELRSTRGVTMSLATFDSDDDTMTWLGIGNVEGILLHADPQAVPAYRGLVSRPGVVGYRLPPIDARVLPLGKGDLLIFTTDGIQNDFDRTVALNSTAQEIADGLCSRYAKGTDDALVLVARYKGRQ